MLWKDFLELHSNLDPDEEIACIIWTRPDVYGKALENYPDVVMTDEIADEVLYLMDRKSDCEIGITWDSLECSLENVLCERELIPEENP